VNADPVYTARVIEHLRRMSLQPLSRARNLIDATQNTDQLVEISGLIRTGAVSLKKMCADLRLLSSGPACGLNELDLPALQAGSSIMPGKVNPVMCEAAEQICISIMAGDQGLAMAASESNLELPQFLPYIAHTLLTNIDMLAAACQRLAPYIAGITANERQIARHLDHSAAVMTLLSPVIGYDQAAALVHEAHERSVSATNLAVEKGFVTREQLQAIRRPEYMAAPGYIEDKLERDGHLPQ
jgi:aspartate ammonia-lyase